MDGQTACATPTTISSSASAQVAYRIRARVDVCQSQEPAASHRVPNIPLLSDHGGEAAVFLSADEWSRILIDDLTNSYSCVAETGSTVVAGRLDSRLCHLNLHTSFVLALLGRRALRLTRVKANARWQSFRTHRDLYVNSAFGPVAMNIGPIMFGVNSRYVTFGLAISPSYRTYMHEIRRSDRPNHIHSARRVSVCHALIARSGDTLATGWIWSISSGANPLSGA